MNDTEKIKWELNSRFGCPMSMYIVLDLKKRKVLFKNGKFYIEFPVLRCEGHYLDGPHFVANTPENNLYVKIESTHWEPPKNNIALRMRGKEPDSLEVNELGACLGDEPFLITLPLPGLRQIYDYLFKLSYEGRYKNESQS